MAVSEEILGAGGTKPAGPGGSAPGIVVRFVLPKGGYATTVLGRAFRLRDAALERPSDAEPEAEEEPA